MTTTMTSADHDTESENRLHTTLAQATKRQTLDIQECHRNALKVFEQLPEKLLPKHANAFFEKVQKREGTAQQFSGDCILCGATVKSTGSFKFHSHLLLCPTVPNKIRKAFQALRSTSEGKRCAKRELETLNEEEERLEKHKQALKQVELKQLNIRAGFKALENTAADVAVAEFFYSNAIPFSAASGAAFRNMVAAIQTAQSGYVPPNAARLSNDLLDDCYDKMWRKMDERDKGGTLTQKFGSTYVADGWDSCDNVPLINSAFITANDGGMFWRSLDTSGSTKSADYCAAQMIEDIYNYGPFKVVLVISDTCSTMQKCWAIVQDEFPWISVLPCQPHVISLLMKDLGKTKAVTELIHQESTIVQWFSNHHFPLAKLREITKAKLGKAKELIKAGATTRFGTNTLVGQRLLELKSALQATVVDEEYAAKNYKDLGSTEEETGSGKVVRSNKGATTKKLVLDDTGFWEKVNVHVKTTIPVFKMLRRFDTGAPTVGKLYSSWFELGEHLNAVEESEYKQIAIEKHAERWAYGHADFAAAAYVLDPEFHAHSQESNTEVMEGFHNTVEKLAILNAARALSEDQPNLFRKDWDVRKKSIVDDPTQQTSWAHFPKYPGVNDAAVKTFCANVSAQLSIYRNQKGVFAREWVFESAEKMPAYLWWDEYGSSMPELQQVARIVLAQPSSSSICERINGEFGFVKDIRRNRLSHAKGDQARSAIP